jgi:hypothetical protein
MVVRRKLSVWPITYYTTGWVDLWPGGAGVQVSGSGVGGLRNPCGRHRTRYVVLPDDPLARRSGERESHLQAPSRRPRG